MVGLRDKPTLRGGGHERRIRNLGLQREADAAVFRLDSSPEVLAVCEPGSKSHKRCSSCPSS